MCHRPTNLPRLIEEFEEHARQLYSNWVFKPLQEPGTVPVLPKSRSELFQDTLKKRRETTPQERLELLACLDETLKDDYDLALQSEFYERSSADQTNFGHQTDSLAKPLADLKAGPIDEHVAERKAAGGVQRAPKRVSLSGLEVDLHLLLDYVPLTVRLL